MNNRTKENGRSEIYDSDYGDLGSGDFVFFSTEDVSSVFTEQFVWPNDFGNNKVIGQMGSLYNETNIQGSPSTAETSDSDEETNIPFAYTSFAKEKKITTDLQDFGDEEEQWAAYAIYSAAQSILKLDENSFSWMFSSNQYQITFAQCCDALYTRPEVFQLRMLYELWRTGSIGFSDIQHEAIEPPSYVTKQAFSLASFSGISIVETVWNRPGVTHRLLKEKGINQIAIDALIAEYIISETTTGSLFVTGINPILKQHESGRFISSGQRSWSSYFPK